MRKIGSLAVLVLALWAVGGSALSTPTVGNLVPNGVRDWFSTRDDDDDCRRPKRVVRIKFSATKYPHIRRHFRAAVRRGWPRTLVINRDGADERRDRLLANIETRDGFDRDEYPPAVGRGEGPELERGRNPRGWRADVDYVESRENQSHGASLGAQLSGLCDGTRFRYVFGR